MSPRRPVMPWLVWGVALLAYVMAVVNRSSFASLGPTAQQHFGIDATTLAMFAMVQLVVYAAMQIPVGTLVDRVGPTALLLSGGTLMVVGQSVLATAGEVWLAIFARVLIGAGDACTFICVMRMLPEWFPARQLPTLSQVTSLVGQAGQLISVTPLAYLVARFGWTAGFLGLAAVSLVAVLLGFFTLRDDPRSGSAFQKLTGRRIADTAGPRTATTGITMIAPPATETVAVVPLLRGGTTRGLLGLPGVRLAYWTHFTACFSMISFLLLWGTPFLTGGVGLSSAAAGGLLNLMVIATMIGGLLMGPLSTRFARHRVWINWGICLAILLTWILTLGWPGSPPVWLLAVTMIVVSLGGPAAMISFEVLRSHCPRSFAGFATGLVNTGGYTAAFLVILLIGLALDAHGAGSLESYSLGAFKLAFAVQIPFLLLGLTMIMVEWRRTRAWVARRGPAA